MDLEPRRYETFEELPGLLLPRRQRRGAGEHRDIRVPQPGVQTIRRSTLGTALQLTNILRDIREDWENGERIYLPDRRPAAFPVLAQRTLPAESTTSDSCA